MTELGLKDTDPKESRHAGSAPSGRSCFCADRLKRFEQEARLAGSLNHPNLVVVHDVGSEGGAPFLVTELLEGESLRHRLARGRLPLRTALELGAQIAEGLAAALSHFHKILASENYPYQGSGEKNILIPTSLGSLHPTGLVPETFREGDLSASGSVLLLGFEGLKDFFPYFAAENLNLLHQKGAASSVFRAAILKRPDLEGKVLNGLSLASAFEKEDFRASFAKEIRSLGIDIDLERH